MSVKVRYSKSSYRRSGKTQRVCEQARKFFRDNTSNKRRVVVILPMTFAMGEQVVREIRRGYEHILNKNNFYVLNSGNNTSLSSLEVSFQNFISNYRGHRDFEVAIFGEEVEPFKVEMFLYYIKHNNPTIDVKIAECVHTPYDRKDVLPQHSLGITEEDEI